MGDDFRQEAGRAVRTILVATSAVAIASCGGDTPTEGGSGTGGTVALVEVSPLLDTLYAPDRTLQMRADARDADGTPLSGTTFLWESSNPDVATVNATTGLVAAVGEGNATITATAEGVEGTATIVAYFGPERASLTFTDQNLSECVFELAFAYANEVTVLVCAQRGIVSVEGVEALARLEVLQLGINEIADISPLGALSNLRTLGLGYNQIVDVAPLVDLVGLRTLILEWNAITDVAPLGALTSLESLWLRGNSIADIAGLSSLSGLRDLDLSANLLTSIDVIADLQGLQRLSIGDNALNVDDYAVLESLPALFDLNLEHADLADLSPFAGLTTVEFLGLSHNRISTVAPITGLANLRGLYLGDNLIGDAAQFGQMTHLEHLGLGDNNIDDVTPLSSLTPLLSLDLANSAVTTGVASLVSLTNAQQIRLDGNPQIPCADLEALVDALGSDVVTPPTSCVP